MATGNDKTYAGVGRYAVDFRGDVNWGDTTYRDLFQLPAGCEIVDGRIIGYYAGPSNAQNCTLSVGISPSSGGAGTEYLNAWSLSGSQGSNFQAAVPWTRFGAQNSNTFGPNWSVGSNSFWVSGKIGGSTGPLAGMGPYTIVFEVLTP